VSEDINLAVDKRDLLGKKVKQLRASGKIPAVIHDHGKPSVHISIDELGLKKAYSKAGRHHAVKLNVDGQRYTTIVKEVVNVPASSSISHAVFQAIKADEKVTAEVPLKLVGEIPAEKANLLVLKNLEHITIEALPKDLIDVVEVDATSLEEIGNKLHVSDVKLPEAITIKTDPEQAIAAVEMPKDQIAEADAALEEQKAAEGEAAEEAEEEKGEAADVPFEKGTDSEGGQSEGEIRPGGKKEFEDKSQGHNPDKK
jgi:large subunit ribosomal protein L25